MIVFELVEEGEFLLGVAAFEHVLRSLHVRTNLAIFGEYVLVVCVLAQ